MAEAMWLYHTTVLIPEYFISSDPHGSACQSVDNLKPTSKRHSLSQSRLKILIHRNLLVFTISLERKKEEEGR
jgi:hypothetical protein